MRHLLSLRYQITAAFFSVFIVCLVFTSAAQGPASTGLESIRAEDLRQKLTYIASEQFKGRGNGTPELNMAAQYIAGVFEKNGLKPAGSNDSFDQQFNVYSSRLGPSNELHFRGAGVSLDLDVRSDFIPELWSESGKVTAPIEFLDDNRPNSNLKGKIALEFEDVSQPAKLQNLAVRRLLVDEFESERARIQAKILKV